MRFPRMMLPQLRRPRGFWVNTGLGAALVAASTGAYFSIGGTKTATTSSNRISTVRRGTVTATVTASGNIDSATSPSMSFGASGTVTEVNVTVGDTVAAGEVLAGIDDSDVRADLSEAQAKLKPPRPTTPR